MGKCDFVLENVDWLAQLRRALKVEDCFFQGNQLPLFGSPPTWRAVSMLTPRWGFLGDWTNLFSVGYLLPASPPLHLPECLPLLLQPFILLDGMDPVFVPHHLDKSWWRRGGFLTMFFWLTHHRKRREQGKECVHLLLCVYMCAREGTASERWQPGSSLLFVVWEITWHLLMTSDLSVSAKTMRMVLKVSDRVLTSHRVHLMLLHTWGFFFNWSIDARVLC